MNRIVRELTIRDLPMILKIEQDSFDDPWPVEAFDGAFKHPCFGVVIDGELAGFILYHKVLDEAVILNFALSKIHRRKGHGEYLLAQSMKSLRAEGCNRFYLDVRKSNEIAISLYMKYGFQGLGYRKGYYHAPPEDALIMGAYFTPNTQEVHHDL